MRLTTASLLIPVACIGIVSAQTDAVHPKFDAASVKLDTRGILVGPNVAIQGGPGTSDPGRFNISYGKPLRFLLAKAYDVPADQIAGPAWFDDVPGNLYTITATMSPAVTREQFLLMLQDLLAERFHLALHHETRDFPGYALVVASDRPKLKEWTPDPKTDQAPGTAITFDEQGFPRLYANQASGFRMVRKEGAATRIFETHHQSMAEFAKGLGQALRQAGVADAIGPMPRVVDKTGLSGAWDFRFQYEGSLNGPERTNGEFSDSGLSFFTEIEKQLGLKLVKTKGVPVDTIVIDRAEKIPAEN
jgi:uncharacterized protein (TIGR03435 family)